VPTSPLEHTTALPHLCACAVRPRNKQFFYKFELTVRMMSSLS
jgi:hypothetical protein